MCVSVRESRRGTLRSLTVRLHTPSDPLQSEGLDARRASASASLSKWGLVQGWLATDDRRRIEIRGTADGMEVCIVDPVHGTERTAIRASEDPSSAAWRAIVLIDRAR